MKSFRYFYLLVALMAFSACSDDDEVSQEQDLVTNGGKVLINAVVEPNSLFTRSNPMGEDDAQQGAFNQGDKLAINCGDDVPVIYTMGSDKIWTAGENSLMWRIPVRRRQSIRLIILWERTLLSILLFCLPTSLQARTLPMQTI